MSLQPRRGLETPATAFLRRRDNISMHHTCTKRAETFRSTTATNTSLAPPVQALLHSVVKNVPTEVASSGKHHSLCVARRPAWPRSQAAVVFWSFAAVFVESAHRESTSQYCSRVRQPLSQVEKTNKLQMSRPEQHALSNAWCALAHQSCARAAPSGVLVPILGRTGSAVYDALHTTVFGFMACLAVLLVLRCAVASRRGPVGIHPTPVVQFIAAPVLQHIIMG